ncbi:MAG: alpha/beta hydrolase [Candidatus Kryptonium sp.]|nr:alpha/beta hydrolase [Candidatus Kryptonium sp.]MDW8109488.1 alpha/beta hydrolase [Candidatus Kryptonium sp.]
MLTLLLSLTFVLLLSYFLIVNFIGPAMILKPKQKNFLIDGKVITSPTELGLNYESVEIKSFDGVTLKAWLILANPEPIGNVIYIHGAYTNKAFGLKKAKFLNEACFNVLLVDLRYHGESGGRFCTYGYLEKFDISEWISFLVKRFPNLPVALFGTSAGAAIAIQTAGIDNRVCAVIAEGSFANFYDLVLEHQKKKFGFTSEFLMKKVLESVERTSGIKIDEISPLEYAKKISCPVLYIHGKEDKTVKSWHSVVLHRYTLRGEILLVDGAGHLNSWEVLGDAYRENIVEFLRKNCIKNKT